MILAVKNSIPTPRVPTSFAHASEVSGTGDHIAERIARRSLAERGAEYSAEVRRLLDAGREVMRRCGTETRPRVVDIVVEAGLSNDAFYRHFKSKDALVAAILEDGTLRLQSYLAHQIDKATDPEERIRRWVEGILDQAADDAVAATTRAVLWNAGDTGRGFDAPDPATILAPLVLDAFADLGSPDPAGDSLLAAHAVIGALSDRLRAREHPDTASVDRIVAFVSAAVRR